MSHLKILWASNRIWGEFHAENPKILVASLQNIGRHDSALRIVQPCFISYETR